MRFHRAFQRDINISAACNGGFIAQMGCCMRVYSSAGALISDLQEYLADPDAVERQYLDFDKRRPLGIGSESVEVPQDCLR